MKQQPCPSHLAPLSAAVLALLLMLLLLLLLLLSLLLLFSLPLLLSRYRCPERV
jgi:hypothetical protein